MTDSLKKCVKGISRLMFIEHPFVGAFLVLMCCELPWWFAFWPGTLQYDSCGQLLQYLGVAKMTGHHPVPVTMLMGVFLNMGRHFFQSDNVGIFLYTLLQFTGQCLVISYGFCVFRRFRLPVWFCWGALLFYGVFPLLPNWGISYVKDSGYYICFLLLTISMVDAFGMERGQDARWKRILWIAALVGLNVFRNDGRYVAVAAIIGVMLFRHKYFKTCLAGAGCLLLFLFLVEGAYMPLRNIPSGALREAMSVPLLQTADYIKKYPDEITVEEYDALMDVFDVDDLGEISNRYDNMISDRIKDLFLEYPSKEQINAYLKTWWSQLKKHPIDYLRVYWEHSDGYFNPIKRCYEDIIGWYTILDEQSRTDDYLDIHFRTEGQKLRVNLENLSYSLYDFPLIGCLYHPGTYTWIMLGSLFALVLKGRKRDLFVILPGIVVLMVCTASPLNASVRYYLPIMSAAPIYIGYCIRNCSG